MVGADAGREEKPGTRWQRGETESNALGAPIGGSVDGIKEAVEEPAFAAVGEKGVKGKGHAIGITAIFVGAG